MLTGDPHAIVTPWNRSRKLPTQDDLSRLGGLTKNLHITAPPADLARVKHDYEVDKLLRDFGIQTFREVPEVGPVTVRKRLSGADCTITRSAP